MNDTNIATIQQINTPFYDSDYEDYEDHYYDEGIYPSNTVAKRMILILAIVPLVALLLSFLAIPISGNVTAIESNPSELTLQDETQNINFQEEQVEITAPILDQESIAPFFTPEVKFWESKIIEWANIHGVDPNAVATIMQIESCGDPQALSIAGARGLFQVMPFHFSSGEDMLDPDTNATRGLNFLNEQLRYTDGDIFLSFAGYNGGYAASGGAYENWASETQRYYTWARGIYEDASAGKDTSETLDAWLAAGGAAGCQRAASRLNIN